MSAAVQPAPTPFVATESQLVVAYSVCRSIARAAAKNFYYAFLVLPGPKRQALCAVYAFMRRCDDITDDAAVPLHERRQKLATWFDALHRAAAGQPTDEPVLLALTDAQRRYNIPLELLDQLAHGTEMDIDLEDQIMAEFTEPTVNVFYSTFEDLRLYCYRVASVVGLICIRIFGYRDAAAEPLAERCGLAFQLTNIIRDVKEDALMGRVYLPEEDLVKFGIFPLELRTATDGTKFRALLAMEADRAREYYESGDQLIPLIDEDSQPALWALITIYRRLLERITLAQYEVFQERVSLSTVEKSTVLAKALLKRLA